jgi:hypothetical protein
MTKEARLRSEIESFFRALKEEGVQFAASFIIGKAGKHAGFAKINAKDDHHVLDLAKVQADAWSFLNHKAKK